MKKEEEKSVKINKINSCFATLSLSLLSLSLSLFLSFSLSLSKTQNKKKEKNHQQSHIEESATGAFPPSSDSWIAAMHLSYHSPARSKSPRSA